jgi:trigger factor
MFGWGKKKKEEGPAQAVAEKEKPLPARAAEPEPSDLEVKVAERQACAVTLSVKVPASRVRRAVEEAFRDIQGRAKLPGFRPGKAPLELIKKNFTGSAWEQAVNALLRESAYRALEKEKLEAVAPPAVDKVKAEMDKPLQFEMNVECAPEVRLGTYKGLPVKKASPEVTPAEIEKRVEEIREVNAKLAEVPEAAVTDKHFAVVDYVGLLDGQPIEGGKAENQLIEMSAPQTISGFTEGLVGARAGETRQVPVKFPDDHPNKALAGKTVAFQITVTAVKEKRLPAPDDELAKDVGCQSLADLQDRIRKSLEREKERAARQEMEKQVIDRLLEAHAFDVPPTLVEDRTRHLTEQAKQYLLRLGASEEDWKANEEKIAAKNRAEAERQVRLSYLLSEIAEKEKLEVSDPEVEGLIRKTVDSVEPARKAEMQKWMEGRRDTLRAQLKEEKIFTFLIENAACSK